ncbi:TIGR02301 family protein [Rhodoblastus sphagnicola]|uniref:TIGR02301 family protein n=2 Tax=Rhodoblastus sphagnicola TaxID=333368 RepID=A0A2S6N555_9HYPH|nr:TIGR02301 family protein [Rhodoblastus sphagnicola]
MAPWPKLAVFCALAALLAPAEPARAQFFQFFDNRPPPPPVLAPQRQAIPRKPHKPHKAAPEKRRAPVAKPEPQKPAPATVVETAPPSYQPQLLRLSEIMGALAALDPLCGEAAGKSDESAWRQSMRKLMDSQDAGPLQRERLAGAYNHGLRGYEYFHRQCTPVADLARRRLLEEGGRLAHDITTQYSEK